MKTKGEKKTQVIHNKTSCCIWEMLKIIINYVFIMLFGFMGISAV